MDTPVKIDDSPVDETIEEERVPLLFKIPDNFASRYAQHVIVQLGENEVTLSFFEVFPPLTADPEAQLTEARKGVRADCVSRIVMAKSRYAAFPKAFAQVLSAMEQSP